MINGVLLSGKKFAGKDHVADHIAQVILGRTPTKFAWATAVRLELIELLECAGIHVTLEELQDQRTKNKYVRGLQWLGTDLRRAEDPDYWVKRGLDLMRGESVKLQVEGKPKPLFINTDTRFHNEVAARKHGFICIRLTVSRAKQEERARKLGIVVSPEEYAHLSETALDHLENGIPSAANPWAKFDAIVDSDQELPQVYAEVDRVLKSHGLDLRSV